MRQLKKWLQQASDNQETVSGATPGKRKRPGVTAMEYLVALTFILVVLILAVQHVGAITGGMLGNSAKATNFSGS